MKSLILILLFITLSIDVFSQTEITKDSLPNLNRKLDIPKSSLLEPDNSTDALFNADFPDYRPFVEPENSPFKLDLPPVTFYQYPLINTNPVNKSYPFANDYSFYDGHILSDKAWLTTSSVYNNYPTLGALRAVNFQVNYQPASWLVVGGGAYTAKYNLYGQNYNDAGASGAVKFILHDRIRVNGYGQYSVSGRRNGIGAPMAGMFPQTYYGGSLEFKITQKFGVEGGVIREINPFNGKWVNRPYIAPVFYSK